MFSNFVKDTGGAVTVDWVLVLGVAVAFGLAIATFVAPPSDSGAGKDSSESTQVK